MISTTGVSIGYSPNGTVTTFSFPYTFLAAGDLVVQLTDTNGNVNTMTLGSQYTVTGGGFGSSGGSVVFNTAPTGTALIITRQTAITQPAVYVNNDSFPAATTEGALDRLTLIAQETAYGVTQWIANINARPHIYLSTKFSTWAGTPNGIVTANVGDLCIDITSGAIWEKLSGGNQTNTGWA